MVPGRTSLKLCAALPLQSYCCSCVPSAVDALITIEIDYIVPERWVNAADWRGWDCGVGRYNRCSRIDRRVCGYNGSWRSSLAEGNIQLIQIRAAVRCITCRSHRICTRL